MDVLESGALLSSLQVRHKEGRRQNLYCFPLPPKTHIFTQIVVVSLDSADQMYGWTLIRRAIGVLGHKCIIALLS